MLIGQHWSLPGLDASKHHYLWPSGEPHATCGPRESWMLKLSFFRSHFFCPLGELRREVEEELEWNLIKSLFEVRKCTGPTRRSRGHEGGSERH